MERSVRVNYSERFLKKLSRTSQRFIAEAEEKERVFKLNPFHPSLETHKLHGKDKDAWAFSINRKYRIKFIFLAEDAVLFLDLGTHDIYR